MKGSQCRPQVLICGKVCRAVQDHNVPMGRGMFERQRNIEEIVWLVIIIQEPASRAVRVDDQPRLG